MKKEMLINNVEGKECRIVVLGDDALQELYMERESNISRVGNIYKARVTNVEPSIQAAFVDFGCEKNGFLHISDVHPHYFPKSSKGGNEPVGQKRSWKDRPPIQDCLRRGQEVVIQMTKEGIGTKGPTMTTYLSIPGRLLVMMPGMSRLGVSRKIEDEKDRDQLRKQLEDLKPPPDMGFIVRTAGVGHTKRELQRDLNYLVRLWKTVKEQMKNNPAPSVIYKESDLVLRTLRDVYNSEIDRVVCDRPSVADRVREFLRVAMPRTKHNIEVYRGHEGLFYECGIEEEIEKIYSRRVEMPSGGSLVIEQTEALVAIDVNSGRYRDQNDPEATATKINKEAAREIARQLRLRDLGGVIIMDFIDMREQKNNRAVERELRNAMKPDRAKTRVLKISNFGIIEMTRQRVRPSLKSHIYEPCHCCEGAGLVKTPESLTLNAIRNIRRAAYHDDVAHVTASLSPAVAMHMANHQRRELADLESESGVQVEIRSDADLATGELVIECLNARGAPVAWEHAGQRPAKAKNLKTVNVENLAAEEIEKDALLGKPKDADEKDNNKDQKDESKGAGSDNKGEEDGSGSSKRRRGRRRGRRKNKSGSGDGDNQQKDDAKGSDESDKSGQSESKGKSSADAGDDHSDNDQGDNKDKGEDGNADGEGKKRSGRRRSGRRRRKKPSDGDGQSDGANKAQAPAEASAPAQTSDADH